MTAVAGLWNIDGRPAEDGIGRMLSAQRIYGPDNRRDWTGGNVALGRQLMRILPEDAFDTQPVIGSGGRYVLVADARVDNRDELTDALGLPRDRMRRSVDADYLLLAFERWGEACLDRVLGDYAFAIWDSVEHRWFIARDATGARPLHYFKSDRCFAVASMPKGLHALAEVPYEPDEELLARGLDWIFPDNSASCFRHILKVPKGCFVVIEAGRAEQTRHWTPARTHIKLKRPAEYHEALREHLDRAVDRRLRGSTDVATHLSAGLDSSAVTATAARLQARAGNRVVAYTAVPRRNFDAASFEGRLVDEGPYAAETAALYPNIDHVLIRTEGRSPLDGLDRAFHLYEQPQINLCNGAWIDAINDDARSRGLKVMLTGAMGNITLSYNGNEALAELVRRGRWLSLVNVAVPLALNGELGARRTAARMFGPFLPRRLWRFIAQRVRLGIDPATITLLAPARRAEFGATSEARHKIEHLRQPSADSWQLRVNALNGIDSANLNKGMLAYWRVDHRDPTADRRLVEFCLSVPPQEYLRSGVTASLARHALADRLPPHILRGRKKGLQAADWFMGIADAPEKLTEEADRLAEAPVTSRLLDIRRLRRMIEAWPSNDNWSDPRVNADYRLGMLRAISVGHFLRRATRSNS